MAKDKLVLLGEIVSTHGVRGAVKIHSYTEYPEDIVEYSPLQDEQGRSYDLKFHSINKNVVVAMVKGCSTMDQAEALRGTKLYIPRDEMPETEEGEYYIEDLVGLAILSQGEKIGKVLAVENFGAGDIMEIAYDSGKASEYFPFIDEIFPEVDLAKGHVVFVAPEELVVKG